MKTCLSAFACLLAYAMCSPGLAVVIDDFSQGAIDLQSDGTPFHKIEQVQTGLDPAHVIGGVRRLQLQEGSRFDVTLPDNVSLTVDTAGDGRLVHEADGGLRAINTYLTYNGVTELQQNGDSNLLVDLAPDGENALVFHFEHTMFQGHGGSTNGFLDITLRSDSTPGNEYMYVRLPSSPTPFSIALDFSLLTIDPTRLTWLSFGTGNGNLPGSLALSKIESKALAPGDFNGDDLVDAADYEVWRLGAGGGLYGGAYIYAGDANDDGLVDGADYTLWRDAMAAGPLESANSPEPAGTPAPTSATLLACLAVAGALRRPAH